MCQIANDFGRRISEHKCAKIKYFSSRGILGYRVFSSQSDPAKGEGSARTTVLYGGNGNDWQIPSGYEWDIYTNIGKIARISLQTEQGIYYEKNKGDQLSDLGIKWVYAARDIDEINVDKLEDIFSD